MNPKLQEILTSLMPKPEDVILIKSLFSHPGWTKYEEAIKIDIESLSAKVDQLTDGTTPLNEERLNFLKHIVGIRYALRLMLVHKDELLDSVKNPLEEEREEEPQNFTPGMGAE